jgi:4-hydroxythreonine-4-phosphate dehydrogenase
VKRSRAERFRIALSVGCPAGIGPEVSVAAAHEFPGVLLVGDLAVLKRAAEVRGIDPERVVRVETPAEAWAQAQPKGTLLVWQPTPSLRKAEARPGKPTRAAGAAQLAWIDAACDLASRGEADAMVTGPASKEVIRGSGARGARNFIGHTEHLQERLGAREVVMAFAAEALTTALATTHLPISAVPRAITTARVATACYWLGTLVADLAGHEETLPIAVASLNPHAGEGGLFGSEEARAIVPGMERARARLRKSGVDVTLTGPVPAESAFRLAVAGRFQAVLAMYHDQATIASKLAGFGEAVNISLGLPIVRTSVDHGTAYDIAFRGVADPRGMREALVMAERLSRARRNCGTFG